MKLAMIGDLHSDTGPGIANRELKRDLETLYDVRWSRETGILRRLWELCTLALRCDVLVLCSATLMNYPAVWLARLRKKSYVYIMHGLSTFEDSIEHPPAGGRLAGAFGRYERYILAHAGRIVCVSGLFRDWIIERFPFCEGKIDYVYNAVDTAKCEAILERSPGRVPGAVVSAGGGKRQKNIGTVAVALEEIGSGFVLHVAGSDFSQGDEIRSHGNVVWHGNMPHDDFLALLAASALYVQNSVFETFGLAVVEALFCGCSILVSENTGCLPLFGSLRDEDIIRDVYDKEEISRKIRHLMAHPNNARLREGFSGNLISGAYRAKRLKEIIDRA